MDALVTGATGLVGKQLVESLLEHSGFNLITVVVRDPSRLRIDIDKDKDLHLIPLDLTADTKSFDVLKDQGPDVVWFHVAAAISGASDEVLKQVNIAGTKKLVQVAEKAGIAKFFLVSSVSTYGVRHPPRIKEDYLQRPDSSYGLSKLEQERIVIQSNIPWTIIRPPYIGGPGDQNFLATYAMRIQQQRMPRISRDGYIAYIDVRDLVDLMIRLSLDTRSNNQIYNVQTDEISVHTFIKLFADKLGVEPPYGSTYPYPLALLAGSIRDLVGRITGQSTARSLSRYRVRSLTGHHTMNIDKIKSLDVFHPKFPIEQSINEWLRTWEYTTP